MADTSKVKGLIEQITVDNSDAQAIASTAYGYCNTPAATAAKTVDMTGFKLIEGVTIHIKFEYSNTASSPTLNVNNTGAIAIMQYGTTAAAGTPETTGWQAGAVVSFTYDGTNWIRDQGYNTNVNTKMRTYTGSADYEYPLLAQSSTTNATSSWTEYTTSYKDYYGIIPNSSTTRATINTNTGRITVPGGITTPSITAVNNDITMSGNIIFPDSNTILWDSGNASDSAKPKITVSKDSSSNANILKFTFNSTDLFTISNSGNVWVKANLTLDNGIFSCNQATIGEIVIGATNTKNSIATISHENNSSNKDLVLSPAEGKMLAFQQTTVNSTATTRIVLQENTFYPPTNNSVSLGLADNRWKNIYAEELIVIGNSVGVSNSPRALRIFNASTNYTDIKSQAAANKTFYLPAYNGTGDMYATHVGGSTAVGDASTPVYVAANGRITKCDATVGSQYQPVYLDQGTFTAAYPVQYLPWSFASSGHNQILFESNIFGVSTYVLSIVVTSGESNLKGPITWETTTTNGTGQLILQTNPAVAGEVRGYILISLGTDLSSTISGTSSTVNI